ncbi:MAG TPA: methylenetetrahydrofolate reductase [Caulobacteraceae bacterium]|nr:methylenetetrahydrofolate reductase [Caulobacteraceae bacterium]
MLKSKLDSGRFALTAEVVPPLSADPEDLLKIARPLKGLADAVNITDGASARAHIDVMVGARLLHDIGVEPILQLTCRDRNRIALQSLLIGAAALDLTNILVLTGDDPKKGDQPDAKPVFDLDSTALMATAVSIRDEHQLPHGRKVKGPIDYFLGVADSPIDPAPGWAPTGLAKKVAAGAQFAQTQFCMDAGVVRRYLARLAEHGLAGKIKFLIGVAPLASAKSASWIRENLFGSIIPDAIVERLEKAADPKAEGAKICIEYIQQLAEIPGVSGAHVMAPLNEKAVPEVLTNARKALA